MSKQTITATFTLEEEKKNSVRYMEVDEDGALPSQPVLRTLYVSKDHIADPYPQTLEVTIKTS